MIKRNVEGQQRATVYRCCIPDNTSVKLLGTDLTLFSVDEIVMLHG